jgi:hypothetical protein
MSEPGSRRHSARLVRVGAPIIGAAVLTLGFTAMSSAGGPPNNMPATGVFADFRTAGLVTTKDGTPLAVYDNGGNATGLAVVNSQLTHGAPLIPNAAGYLEAGMAAPVTRIGAIVSFHGANSGAVGLLSWANSLVASRGAGFAGPLPNGGMHFAVSNTKWIFSVWDSAADTTDTLLDRPLALATDGTEYAFELVRDGDTVTVRLPDGTTQSTEDPRIGQWSGTWACWELYEADETRVPATIAAIWAS